MLRRLQSISNWVVLFILVIVAISSSIGSIIVNADHADAAWWSGWLQNFSTEIMGAIVTFALFELVIGTVKEKKNLIIQMRNADNTTALNATAEMRVKGFVADGSLRGADLRNAQLQGAYLWQADLRGAHLFKANLSGAILFNANLKHARDIETVRFDEKTVLPDSHLIESDEQGNLIYDNYWTPETDMTRYTNPDHPDFWKPDRPSLMDAIRYRWYRFKEGW
jgi:hypothetical protein